MKFKVELLLNSKEFIKVYFADTLTDLFTQIQNEFPKAKIVGIIGGG